SQSRLNPPMTPINPVSGGFLQTRTCFVSLGGASKGEPNTTDGLGDMSSSTLSRAAVVLSLAIASRFSPVLYSVPCQSIPYGGSVTSTSASSQSVISRQSP